MHLRIYKNTNNHLVDSEVESTLLLEVCFHHKKLLIQDADKKRMGRGQGTQVVHSSNTPSLE